MTPAEAAWLRKLRDEGPQKAAYPDDTPLVCEANDWACLIIGNAERRLCK